MRAIFAVVACILILSSTVFAELYRKIDDIRASALSLRDIDGDEVPELLWAQRLDLRDCDMASHNLRLAQVYKVKNYRWVLADSFVIRVREERPEKWHWQFPPSISSTVPKQTLKVKADMDGDGKEETVEMAYFRKEGMVTPGWDLRILKQDDLVYQSRVLEGGHVTADEFDNLEVMDCDGDGIQEIIIWANTYTGRRCIIYALASSKWKGGLPSYPKSLEESLHYIQGFRAGNPQEEPPVVVEASAEKTRYTRGEPIPVNLVFRQAFEGGNQDLSRWRNYFLKWMIGHMERYNPRTEHREVYSFPLGDGSGLHLDEQGTVILTPAERGYGNLPPGWYSVRFECPFVEPSASEAEFGWTGTLISNTIGIYILPEGEK